MRIAREEIFGPVLAVMRAKDFADALRIANNIPFGLSASIQTSNVSVFSTSSTACRRGCSPSTCPAPV